MGELCYLDNAATTWPKPSSVIRSMAEAMERCGGNPGRGSHRLSQASSELLYETRCAAAELFHAEPENVVFTMNATQALNLAIKGLVHPGDHILLDNYAHNASYRPVLSLVREKGCTADLYDASGSADELLAELCRKRRKNTTVLIATHQSNICSHILPLGEIGAWCEREGILLIADASQSAGHLPIDLEKMHIGALCLPGHKGLMGPMGIGLLIASPGLSFSTVLEGGAGIASLEPGMPEVLPERLEAGTMPVPAAAGLLAGIRWVQEVGVEAIHAHERELARRFMEKAAELPGMTFFGETDGSVVSFRLSGHSPAEVGERLAEEGICVRTGYHCAPVAHRTVGSLDAGSVRVSFSPMNRSRDADALAEALFHLTC